MTTTKVVSDAARPAMGRFVSYASWPAQAPRFTSYADTPLPSSDGNKIVGAEAVLKAGSCTFVGEVHGSKEIPLAVKDLVTEALSVTPRVACGFEMLHTEGAALRAFLQSDGSNEAKLALMRRPHWYEQGGLASAGIFDIIDYCRQCGCACFGFDAVATMGVSRAMGTNVAKRGTPAHEEAMASTCLHEINAIRADRGWDDDNFIVICLVGSDHCRGGNDGPTLGSLIHERWPASGKVTSLVTHHAGGHTFSFDGRTCGVHYMPADGLVDANGSRIEMYTASGADTESNYRATYISDHMVDGYDGALHLGCELTPSPPAQLTLNDLAPPDSDRAVKGASPGGSVLADSSQSSAGCGACCVVQ